MPACLKCGGGAHGTPQFCLECCPGCTPIATPPYTYCNCSGLEPSCPGAHGVAPSGPYDASLSTAAPAADASLNVIFFIVDDLRPELNKAYDQPVLVTPHLDALSQTALTFSRAYVQYSHCAPSRNSFMSGRSPPVTQSYNFIDHFREKGVGQNWTSLPQFFKDKHGYHTAGGGKLYHPGLPPNNDAPHSWTQYYHPNGDDKGCLANETLTYEGQKIEGVCPSAQPDDAFYDYQLASDAISELQKAKSHPEELPFFLGVGFRRPHLEWHVPRRFYDLYANSGSAPTAIPLAVHKTAPSGTSSES